MGELLKRITAGLLAKAIWELGAWLFLGGSVLAIWAYWDDFLEQPIPLQLLAVASVIVLVVVAVKSARQGLELLDTSPAKIWYKLKWWGIAWHAHRFFNVQGHIDDPRFGWVIVHVKNNTSRAIPNVAGSS